MNAIIFSAIWGVIMMFTGAFVKSKTLPKSLAIAGAVLLLLLNGYELYTGAPVFNINGMRMLFISSANLTFLEVMFAATLIFFLLSGRDVERVGEHVAEYFALIFFILCGVALSSTYNTLLLLFLGIEIMSIPLYVLTGSDKRNLKSNEASLKYFLMGAFSTGILLMGIAFIYGGNANASFYIDSIQLGIGKMPPMITVGLVFLIIGLSFKVSAAPFHFWTPDVYDGSPTVFTSFMSTIVKAAGFFAFIRLFGTSFGPVQPQWQNLIVFITIATMLIGNITAIFQQSVKRMLAYSSIAQAGFMLLSLFALNDRATEGLVLYAAAYSLATIGIFAVLIKMNDYTIEGFNGLAKNHPLLAITTTVCLLSLTGIPLTAGFAGKFYMLLAAVQNGHKYWLVIVAVIFAATSAYYYFRVIQAIYFKEPSGQVVIDEGRVTGAFKLMMVITTLLIIILGLYPELLIGWMYH
jgi:NADH-quinone oxidoreductase subunit N